MTPDVPIFLSIDDRIDPKLTAKTFDRDWTNRRRNKMEYEINRRDWSFMEVKPYSSVNFNTRDVLGAWGYQPHQMIFSYYANVYIYDIMRYKK